MSNNTIIQGEAKSLPFLLKSRSTGRAINLTGATFLLWIKKLKEDVSPVASKADSVFDKSLVASGKVSVWLTASDTYQLAPWTYYGELRVSLTGTPTPTYKIPFELKIEITGIPDGLVDTGVSTTVAELF